MNQTLEETFLLHPIYGNMVKKIKGAIRPPQFTEAGVDYACEKYIPRKNDIWVSTYGKTGTMWASYVINFVCSSTSLQSYQICTTHIVKIWFTMNISHLSIIYTFRQTFFWKALKIKIVFCVALISIQLLR